ncbi:sugar ABC transporter ATP-binding protein [Amycolatopsis acidiphila]|uniref:Sugar ABC transporter ATP-binding protein n=1 Tax=Amycolatopsis acidiphila TaxID=715473 RepID=A0A557ZSI5_9PSEU|nr:sugar ABC transporter ATP-binding protein [Amycolatopsis acidiphila]TVT14984.1 sugar ABC transporter ATP-binding protein [Amycolatopsis acidiphila]UIJ62918.1 sugar ABC transporter ATP-binding protein [Amycolatopsis acidiphila]GHG65050.1 ribose import ATP-binding protein RbsA 1 [Amycolatopsis acidiphila]
MRAPAISVRGAGKSYSGVPVLRDVDLDIAPGEIHSLVGENGAGKSTLLKILGGAIRADTGTISFDGVPASISNPRDSIRHGISLISQEGALVPARTVLENVFLARWSHRAGFARRRADRQAFAELLALTGFAVDPQARVADLPIGTQQQVEILRSLARGARVLAMDEPTAVLTEHEKENLLGLIRRLATGGTTVVLVSHFLDEVLGVADRVTVLRDGNLVISEEAARHTPATLVRHMVGRQLDVLHPDPPPLPADAPVRLAAKGLRRGMVDGVDLTVRAGEILGIAGLVGSGRSETLRLLFGADRATGGVVEVDGKALSKLTPRRAMAAGIALVPESRKEQGLVMARSVRENVALASLGGRRFGPFVRRGGERVSVGQVSRSVDIRAAKADAAIETLSGGNQQKALFAKWLLRKPRVLLIDEPTRGVDVAAKTQIHQLVVELAAEGIAVVVVSSEIEEVLGLAHRVLVLRHGRVAGEFTRGAPREDVMSVAFGQEGESA